MTTDIEARLHELLDTPEPLAAWLAGKADDAVVGIARHGSGCPIAEYVKWALSVEGGILVLGGQIEVYGAYVHPWWSEAFTCRVDALHPWDLPSSRDVPVTAATARDILQQVTGGAS